MEDSHTLTPSDISAILSSQAQWENVDRIVYITFKTLCDLIAVQSLKIEKLEKSIEYVAQSNQSVIQDLSTSIELRVSFTEIQQLLEKKVSKSDLSYILANKPNFQDLKFFEQKFAKIEDVNAIYSETIKRWEDTLSKAELEEIYQLIETKANKIETDEALSSKANKQAVASALHKKVNKSDVESLISTKADNKDLQMLSSAIEEKIEYTLFESFCKDMKERLEEIESIKQAQNIFATKLDLKSIESDFESSRNSLFEEIENLKITSKNSLDKLKDSIESRQFELLQQNYSENTEKISNETLVLRNSIKQKSEALESEIIKLSKNFEKHCKSMETEIKNMKENSVSCQSSIKELTRENQKFSAANNSILADINKLQQDMSKLYKNIEELTKKKANLSQVQEIITITKEESLLTTRQEIHQALVSFKSAFSEDTNSLREEFRQFISKQESTVSLLLEKKANNNELINVSSELSNIKKSLTDFASQDEVDLIRDSLENMQMSLKKKADSDLNDKKKYTENFDSILKELNSKVPSEEIIELLDSKVNIEEVNKSIGELYSQIEKKLNIEDFENQINSQSIINEALCAENRLARWIWKSGEISSSNIIWDVQTVNTSPDIFVWDKGKVAIQVLQPGLYQIEFGFFSRKRPTIGVIVNGDTVIIGGNSMGAKPWGKHLTSGISLVDYLVLPNRSRICITYSGEVAEGFFGIKKL